ncbi:MAG: PEP-CTERM motif protein [Candidatus Scalindua rubra]|uniref:PEP-CTERM motif protein n=1 Tax=Candidatus Scalindua rubra TaxID=1872076 RepID=A0A1E3XBX0_9BACT|nr:MAG: PEP-CTERM motif protein [Candidatus Scalindua rubra]
MPNNGVDTFNVQIDNGNATNSSVSLDTNATIDNLTIDALDSLGINNVRILTVISGAGAGTITNAGSIALNSIASVTDLRVSGGNVNLTGGGTVTMSNFTNNRIHGVVSTNRLTNQAGHTIQGAGQIGANAMALTNQGTINANQTNSLTIDLSSPGINDGTFKASSGGTLIVNDDISGTGNWLADAGTVTLSSGVDVTTTGNIDILNGGSLNLTNATMTGNNLNMSGAGSSISVNSTVELAGNLLYSITNEGK